MFEIKYSLTLEDEINCLNAYKEYLIRLPLLTWEYGYFLPLLLFLMDLPCIYKCLTFDVPFYTGFQEISVFQTVLNLIFAVLLMPQIIMRSPSQWWIPKYRIQREWSNDPEQTKPRKIIVDKTALIFQKTIKYMFLEEERENIYQWESFERYLESDTGFTLKFAKSEPFFIPQRIFPQDQINEFRGILNKHQS